MNNRLRNLLLILLLFPSLLQAQPNVLEWAFQAGSVGYEYGNSLCIDPSGNVLVTGNFTGTTDMDPSAGTNNLTSLGPDDIFFAKYDADGSLLWANAIACTSFAKAFDIYTDAAGSIFLTGYFSVSADFDPQPGNPLVLASGDYDSFFAKYDPSGALLWVKTISSTTDVFSRRIRTDNDGNVILVGDFSDTTDFDPDTSAFLVESAGNKDIFIAKYDSSGNYLWVRKAGGIAAETATGLDVDAAGNIYFAGHFFGTFDFDPGPAVMLLATFGASDVYFSRYSPSGGLDYVRQIGSPGFDQCQDLILDSANNVLLTGLCSPFTDFDTGPGVIFRDSIGLLDIFAAKYGTVGNFIFANTFGSTGIDEAFNIAADGNNNMYITGQVADTTDFDPGAGTDIINGAGQNDAFVTSFDATGNYRWAFTLASALNDKGTAIEATASGTIFVTGGFSETVDFEPDSGSYPVTANSNTDMFLARYSHCSTDSSFIQLVSCDSVLYDGQYYQSPGTYIIAYSPVLGCDSTIVLDVVPQIIDTTLSVNGVTITSSAVGVSYQWIDCGNGNIPLPGDTLQSFTATVNGIYAVVISTNGCSDSSACVVINNVGLADVKSSPLVRVYPNPTSNGFSVEISGMEGKQITVEIYDSFGKLINVIFDDIPTSNRLKLDARIENFNQGIYLLKVVSTDVVSVTSVIKL